MKKVLIQLMAVVIVVTMSLSFVGCNGNKEKPNDSNQTTDTNQSTGTDEQVKIELFNQKSEAIGAFEALIKDFEAQNTNIKIELNSPSEPWMVLPTRVASGEMPDIWTEWPAQPSYREYVANGLIEDITGQKFLENVNPDTVKNVTINGKVYTTPILLGTYGVYYNKKIFNDLKLEVPNTYSEFIKVLDEVKAKGITPITFPDKDVWTCDQLFLFTMGAWYPEFDKAFIDVADGQSKFTDDANFEKVISRHLELRTKYSQPSSLGTGYVDSVNEFAAGNAAMFIQGTWANSFIASVNPDTEFGMFPIPGDTEDSKTVMWIDCSLNISADSKNKEAALKFVEFIVQKDNIDNFSTLAGAPSASIEPKIVEDTIKPVVELLSTGKTFNTPHLYQTAAVFGGEAAIIQEFVTTEDVKDVIKKLNDLWYNSKNK